MIGDSLLAPGEGLAVVDVAHIDEHAGLAVDLDPLARQQHGDDRAVLAPRRRFEVEGLAVALERLSPFAALLAVDP